MAGSARAQGANGWNSPRVDSLVGTAIARRIAQLADTGLIEYRAQAQGYLTFLVQLGTGFPTPPKIVRTDQLALEVYWKSPNVSRQRIVGRRDTLLLPTDIAYHRDHLGIVQNNFPDIIRLGDGDEVQDVPHPLSPLGPKLYDFEIADSLRIAIPGQVFDVYEVKVRPRDDTQPRVVGALYLDRRSGQVVRMALSFTRAALLDPQLEDISIVLENGLIGTRFWLPRHQEIEIRRTGTWFDYPVRGIIRGRWEVSDYQLNVALPAQALAGPEFVQAPEAELRRYPWKGGILDSLPPDVAVTSDADVRRVQEEARALVRQQALRRAESTRLSARGLSDFASVNRVQGLALGVGVERRLAGGWSLAVHPQYGIDDRQWRGGVALDWRGPGGVEASLFARRSLADAHDEPQRSRVVNSIAAQEFGSDATEPYQVKAVGGTIALPAAGLRWTLGLSHEWQQAAAVHARPATGAYAPTIQAAAFAPWHASLRLDRDAPASLLGASVTWSLRGDFVAAPGPTCTISPGGSRPCASSFVRLGRGAAVLDAQRKIAGLDLRSHTVAATVLGDGSGMPRQLDVYLGGPLSAPGYTLHLPAASRGVSERVEARVPIPFYSISLGTFGRAPARATLAPFFNVVAMQPASSATVSNGVLREQRFYPAVGAGLLTLFDIVRLDVARGLGSGGRWTFSLDFAREFWSIL